MSSGEEDFHDSNQSREDKAKKRRVQRACDSCRRKKVRCDGAQMPNNRCSNCLAYNYECSYVEAAKKRGPPKGYVESLENRLEKMEKLLKSLCPDADFTQELGAHIDRETWAAEREREKDSSGVAGPAQSASPPRSIGAIAPGAPIFHDNEWNGVEEQDNDCVTMVGGHGIAGLAGFEGRFHGKSSGFMLAIAARDLKAEYTGNEQTQLPPPSTARRPEFWQPGPWEWRMWQDTEWTGDIEWPPQDLFGDLLDLYFRYSNPFFPLLHRPTFEAQIRDEVHLRDKSFAMVVLLVCAFGARWSDDVRVFRNPSEPSSAGWQWFDGVKHMKRSLFVPATLYDLQGLVLLALFLQATSSPHSAWAVIGMAIRSAQDVGAHRKGSTRYTNQNEEELWKRAFWCLVVMDRLMSSGFGRPCAIQDEDFDLDPPIEVDDEYWNPTDPDQPAFKQPEGKPSQLAFFNSFIKLNEIISFTVRTIYSINKSKVILGFVGPQWEQHIVAELDSALNKWIDSVPDHLRWDPHRENALHFDQSSALYTLYYYIQILIHRPFIPSPRKPSALTFPSLAICTNAARSCSHILDVHRRRTDHILPATFIAAFTSGIVLLISVWGSKKAGVNADPSIALMDVNRCVQTLVKAEARWHAAGRILDVLRELASFGDLPVPAGSPPELNHKRDRDFDDSVASQSPTGPDVPSGPRLIAKGRSLKAKAEPVSPASQSSQVSPLQSHSSPPITRFSDLKLTSGPTSSQQSAQQSQYASLGADNLPMTSIDMAQLPLPASYGFVGQPQDPMMWFGGQGQQQSNSAASPQELFAQQSQAGLSALSFMGGQGQDMFAASAGGGGGQTSYGNGFTAHQTQTPTACRQAGSDVLMAGDTLAMWQNAPTGFEWEDWGSYLSTMAQGPASAA